MNSRLLGRLNALRAWMYDNDAKVRNRLYPENQLFLSDFEEDIVDKVADLFEDDE